MLLCLCQTGWRHIPECGSPNNHCYQNLKFHFVLYFLDIKSWFSSQLSSDSEVPGQETAQLCVILSEVFNGFAQSLQSKPTMIPQSSHDSFVPHELQITVLYQHQEFKGLAASKGGLVDLQLCIVLILMTFAYTHALHNV